MNKNNKKRLLWKSLLSFLLCLSFLIGILPMPGAPISDVIEAEAATGTCPCQFDSYTLIYNTTFYTNTSGVFSKRNYDYTYYFPVSVFGSTPPKTGAVYDADLLLEKTEYSFNYGFYYMYCSFCGTKDSTQVCKSSELDAHVQVNGLTYDSATDTFTLGTVYYGSQFASGTFDSSINKTHTYNTSHSCTDSCRERVHYHTENFDETVHTYTCDGTETNVFMVSQTPKTTQTACGHRGNFKYYEYSCSKCGEYLYCEMYDGCQNSSCWNYYMTNGEYYMGTHPGEHTYEAKYTRYECPGGLTYKRGSRPQETYCKYCNRYLGDFGAYTVDFGYGDTNAGNTLGGGSHWYYVKEPLEGGCYEYGNIHNAYRAGTTSDTNYYQSYCSCGSSPSYILKYINCNDCSKDIALVETEGCSSCGTRQSYTYTLGLWIGGDYIYTGTNDTVTENYMYAYHRAKTLTCTTAEYGDYICDQVVAAMIAKEPEQTINAGESINAGAYVRYLNNTFGEVTCQITGYNPTNYNTWQTVTLSYGTYSTVASKTPRSITIKVYVNRVDFDFTAVSEDTNKGTVSGTGSYTVNTSATATATPKSGYSFEGWYDGNTKVSSEASYTFTMPPNNYTLTAKFSVNNYTLARSSESTTKGSVSGDSGTKAYGTACSVTATANTGYTFEGWYSGNTKVSSSATYSFNMPAQNYTLVAKFTTNSYTLTISSENATKGTVSGPSGSNYYGSSCTVVATANTGYTFEGWYSGSTKVSSNASYTFSMPYNNYTLVAKFTTNNYTLTLTSENTGMGTVSGGGIKAYASSVTAVASPKAGFSFNGWYEGATLKSNKASYGFTMPAQNYSLVAKFIPATYTVSFNADGGTSCGNLTVVYGSAYGALPTPTKAEYSFLGWYIGTTPISSTTAVTQTSDHSLTAKWKYVGPKTKDYIYDETYDPLPTPERRGYTFGGWFLQESNGNGTGTQITAADIVKITNNSTFYAKWTPIRLTVSFDSNGGSACNSITVEYDRRYGYLSALPTPTRSGYTFEGWYISEIIDSSNVHQGSGTQINDGTRVDIIENQTLYAKWKEGAAAVVSMTVYYDANGGTVSPESKTVTKGQQYGTLPTPTKPGHAFSGWFTSPTGGSQVQSTTTVSKTTDHTLYAHWTPNAWYFLDLNGYVNGTSLGSIDGYGMADVYINGTLVADNVSDFYNNSYIYGADYSIMDIKPADGYSYDGLYEAWSGPLSGKFTSDVSIYLKFSPNSYVVSFHPNGGTCTTKEKSVVYKTTYGDLPTPTRTGYVFQGWYTAASGGTQVFSSTEMNTAKNHTLYAHWDYAPYTLVLKTNGGTISGNDTKVFDLRYDTSDYYDISWCLPSRDGYTFTGWYTATSGGTKVYTDNGFCINNGIYWQDNLYCFTGSLTLYAQWEANSYTAKLDGQGATLLPQTSVTMTYDKTCPAISVPLRTGYVFQGFYTQPNCKGTLYYDTTGTSTITWKTANNNVVLYAGWKADSFTMSLNSGAGYFEASDGTLTQGAKNLSLIYLSSDGTNVSGHLPKLIGYKFSGFYTVNGEKVHDALGQSVNDGIFFKNGQFIYPGSFALHARYVANQYTMTLKMSEGTPSPNYTGPFTVTYDKGDYFDLTHCIPIREGYDFAGWYTENGKQVYDNTGTGINDGTYWKDGLYHYLGDITLYARWTQRTYSLTLRPGSGNVVVGSYEMTFDSDINNNIASAKPTRDGYTFTGWYTTATDGVQVFDVNGNYVPDCLYWSIDGLWIYANDLTIYAQWTPNTYGISFDYQTPALASHPMTDNTVTNKKVVFDTTVGIVPTPKIFGWTFNGWFTEPHGQGAKIDVFTNWRYPENRTLYAYWTPKQYDITLDDCNATSTNHTTSVLMTFDAKGATIVPPERRGYTFHGYYLGENGTSTKYYDANGICLKTWTEDTVDTLYAYWTNNDYKVTLNANTGSLNSNYAGPYTVTYDKATYHNIAQFVPYKLGYTFTGWWTAASGGTKVYNADGSCTNEGTYWKDSLWHGISDVTFYAQWTKNPYTITIDGNKGTGSSVVTVPYSTVILTFDSINHHYNNTDHDNFLKDNLATRPGYTLTGYYTLANGGVKLYDKTGLIAGNGTVAYPGYESGYYFYQNLYKYASNMTIYAQWTPITYTISLDLNDPASIPEAKIDHDSFTIIFNDTKHTYGGSSHADYLKSNLPSRVGYTFAGWYTAADGGSKVYNADGSITKEGTYFDTQGRYVYPQDVTLYAHWTANKYTLTLDGNKGTGTTVVTVPHPSITMTYDSLIHNYNNAEHMNYLQDNLAYRVGYTFQGYFTKASNGIKLYNADGTLAAQTIADALKEASASGYYFHSGVWKVANNLTAYAQWVPKTYTITLNTRGATSTTHSTNTIMTFDKTPVTITPPTKHGYNFEGYFEFPDGQGKQYYDKTGKGMNTWVESDLDNSTIYADWSVWSDAEMEYPKVTATPTPIPEIEFGAFKDGDIITIQSVYTNPSVKLSDTQYDVSVAIPSTEEIQINTMVSEYIFEGCLTYRYDETTLYVQVQIPYYVQTIDDDEILHWSRKKVYTSDWIPIPRSYAYWEITQDDLYTPLFTTTKNNAFESTKELFGFTNSDGNTGFNYDIVKRDINIFDPDGTDSTNKGFDYQTTFNPGTTVIEGGSQIFTDGILIVLHEGDIESEELAKTAAIYALQTAYGFAIPSTKYYTSASQNTIPQLKIRSDALKIDSHTVLTGSEYSGKVNVEIPNNSALTAINQNMDTVEQESTVQLNAVTDNGSYTSNATVTYTLTVQNSSGDLVQSSDPANYLVKPIANADGLKVHTPVVSTPDEKTLVHEQKNGVEPWYDGDYEITVDEYIELLKLNLSEILHLDSTELAGLSPSSHHDFNADGYGAIDYTHTASGEIPFDKVILYSETSFYIDRNKNTKAVLTTINNTADDLDFPAGTPILFGLDETFGWYIMHEGTRYYLATDFVNTTIADIQIYLRATECTGNFVVSYGTLAVNGYKKLVNHGYNYAAMFLDLKTLYGHDTANLNVSEYFAFKDCEYKVHYKYITFHWYDTEETAAKVSNDGLSVVTKQGYEAYFYVTQIDDFEGSLVVRPTFTLVDKNGAEITKDILVLYEDYRTGLLNDNHRYCGITPADDIVTKEFLPSWLKLGLTDTIDANGIPKPSQYWTYYQVEVNQGGMMKRTVYEVPMEALHGAYRLPNIIQVLKTEDVPDTALGTKAEFLADWKIRDAVIQSDTALPYVTDGYLRVDLDVQVLNKDGSKFLSFGSLPGISLYYVLGDATNTGLYYQFNGMVPVGTGKNDDYDSGHINTNNQQ